MNSTISKVILHSLAVVAIGFGSPFLFAQQSDQEGKDNQEEKKKSDEKDKKADKSDSKKEQSSLTGLWKWTLDIGDEVLESELTLTEEEGKVTGEYRDQIRTLEVKDGKFVDGKINFTLAPHVENGEVTVNFSGNLAGENLSGKIEVHSDQGTQEFDWNPTRAFSLVDAVGTWQLQMETPDGTVLEPVIIIGDKNGSATVGFVGPSDSEISNEKFEDGTITFDFKTVYDNQPLKANYTLEFDGDLIEGNLHFKFLEIEQEGDMELTGARIVPPKPKKERRKEKSGDDGSTTG